MVRTIRNASTTTQKRHDKAMASAKYDQKRQYDEMKDGRSRWNQFSDELRAFKDELREFQGERRIAFYRLENMIYRLETKVILVLILVIILVLILVAILVVWLDPLHSTVRTISTDIDQVAAACTTADAPRPSGVVREVRKRAASPSIDEALALVPDRFAVVKQRARRCALQEQMSPNVA